MKVYYDRRLLARALPMLLHSKFGQRRAIPKRGGKTVEYRKFATLGVSKVALTEGQPPAGQQLSVTATVAQYGDGIKFSDLVRTTTIDPILEETVDLLAEQAAESIDELIRDTLVTGTNVQYGDGSGTPANRGAITAAHIFNVAALRRAVLTLKLNRARTIGGFYQAIIHPRTAHDLQSQSEWVTANVTEQTGRVFDGSLGTLYGVKFWVTDKAAWIANVGAGSTVDVYQTLIFGADAFGIIDLDGHNLQTIFKPLGSAGTADMLDQQSSMGWKVAFATRILADEFMLRVEHATSTGANT
jgi:N4-gp56 family major capsid protein